MSELDAIKARALAADKSVLSDYQRDSVDDIPALVAALESVLKLHKPEPEPNTMTWEGRYLCSQCVYMDDRGEPSTESYPCPTVTAIHQALGEVE